MHFNRRSLIGTLRVLYSDRLYVSGFLLLFRLVELPLTTCVIPHQMKECFHKRVGLPSDRHHLLHQRSGHFVYVQLKDLLLST